MQALAPFTVIHKGGHADRIVAMNAQDKGSLVVTAGLDHTVRVYDAHTGECVVVHSVMDDITAVALHPIAPLLLVGMHASLCLFEVQLCDPAAWNAADNAHDHSCAAEIDSIPANNFVPEDAGIS